MFKYTDLIIFGIIMCTQIAVSVKRRIKYVTVEKCLPLTMPSCLPLGYVWPGTAMFNRNIAV